MRPPKEFWERLPNRSDVELYEVLVEEDDYLPEAVGAVREELHKRRKLGPETVAKLAFAAAERRKAINRMRADEGSWRHVIGPVLHLLGFIAF